jgi:hypothetical protein
MAKKDDVSSFGCGQLILTLGVISSIVTIFVFATGRTSIAEVIEYFSSESITDPVTSRFVTQTPTIVPSHTSTATPVPTFTPTPTPKICNIPDLVGEDQIEAERIIATLGLNIEKIKDHVQNK